MAQKIIGLDLGSYEVKAVLVEGGFRHLTVRRYLSATVAQDADRPLLERIGEALERLRAMDGMPLKPDAVYVAVPGGAVTSHQISLPFTDSRRIEATTAIFFFLGFLATIRSYASFSCVSQRTRDQVA